MAARLLMFYFVSNSSRGLLARIFTILFDNYNKFGSTYDILRAAVETIKDDLIIQSGVTKSKILIICDEVGKSRDEKLVVETLCALIDCDDCMECFFLRD